MRNTSRLFFVLLILSFSLVSATQADEGVADASGASWAERTLSQMTLEEKIGQLIMVKAEVESMNPAGADYTRLRDAMLRYHLGGFLITVPVEGGQLVKPSPLDAAALTNQLQWDSALPLIFAADFERGLPMRFQGGTGFPHAMAIGATGNPEYAYQFGRITAAEARAIGIHWNFYPDADVNSNPNNPIINTRAFGEDPAEVSAMVAAFVRGTHDGGGLSTAKHFPGHGDTDTDSHLSLSRIPATRARLDQVELAPFRAAIAAGTDAIMVGHLLVPSVEADPQRVATTSWQITTRLLREELGFQGIVVTDAMDMNGLTRIFGGNNAQSAGRAAVAALQAGADLVLVPGDLDGAYNGILAAVRSGELPAARVDQSVLRLLRAKAALGLDRNRFVDLNAVPSALARPENIEIAQQIAEAAITVILPQQAKNGIAADPVREQRAQVATAQINGERRGAAVAPRAAVRKLLPLPVGRQATSQYAYQPGVAPGDHLLVLVFTDDLRSENGRLLIRGIRARVPDARVIFVDDALAPLLRPEVLQAAARAERIVAAVYAIPTAGRAIAGETGSPALEQGPASVLASVLHTAADRTVLVALGNPYIISQYPGVQNYLCTFSNAPVSELSAVRFLFGEIPAPGHLPVTIPGVAARVPMQLATQP